jgi:SHS2 domain-containing protein
MMEGTFAILDHPADLRIRFRAGSLEGLLNAAAQALREYLYEGPKEGPESEVNSTADGTDDFGRFISALNEILFSLQTRRLLVRGVRVDRKGPVWDLILSGKKAMTGAAREIKAATYHDGFMREGPDGWEAEVLFDV